MTRLTIIASGTRGDVQPAIAVGKALLVTGYWLLGEGMLAGGPSRRGP